MEQKLTEDQRDARSLIIVTVSALLFFPAMSLLSSRIEYYCQSCGTYTEELSNITALEICPGCATGDNLNEDVILFI